jgi:hypothetical protein
MRYIVKKNENIVGTINSLQELKALVGFTRQHWYHQEVDGKMTYKSDKYEVVDVVELFYKLNPNYLSNN